MRATWIALVSLMGCESGSSAPTTVRVTTTFPVTSMFGSNSSYLEKYIGQELAFEISFPTFRTEKYMSTSDCANTDAHLADAPREVRSTVAEAQAELLDPLDQDWELSFEICDDPNSSTVSINSVIDPYNLSFGCGAFPIDAQRLGGDGFPVLSKVTATRCNAIILDVVNAYTIGNADFPMTIEVD